MRIALLYFALPAAYALQRSFSQEGANSAHVYVRCLPPGGFSRRCEHNLRKVVFSHFDGVGSDGAEDPDAAETDVSPHDGQTQEEIRAGRKQQRGLDPSNRHRDESVDNCAHVRTEE